MMPTLPGSGFKTLDEVTPDDRASIGGKAFNCARLRQAGFPVPDGLVVPTTATDEEVSRLPDDPWVTALPPDALFAVRSSGIEEDSEGHSFAGIHETRLNVDRTHLYEAALACRHSARSPQALDYRRAQHLSLEDIGIGVLVQRMVPAVTSGVAFTTNPITGSDELVINSSWGLGEALVAGQIEPDEFIVRKSDGARLATRAGAKGAEGVPSMSLTDAQVEELTSLLLRVERFYGAPQDVEWCRDREQSWIVQSRPVTVHRAPGSEPDIEWTRANLAEVLPDQTSPLALDAIAETLNLAYRRYMGRLVAPESVLGPMVKAFHGRLYFNLSQQRHLFAASGFAPADVMRALGHAERIRPEDEVAARVPLRDRLVRAPDMVRIGVATLRAPQTFARHEERVREAIARLDEVDPRALSDRELWDALAWWKHEAPEHIEVVFVMGSVALYQAMIRKACGQVGFPYDRLMYSHLAAGPVDGPSARNRRSSSSPLRRSRGTSREAPVTFARPPPSPTIATRSPTRSSSRRSIAFSTATAIADATNRTGRCRGITRTPRRSCMPSACICRARRRICARAKRPERARRPTPGVISNRA
jgi:hypothetical protein